MVTNQSLTSNKFKSEIKKSIISIGLFVFTYFLMIVAAMGLTLLCAFGGYMLFTHFPGLITFALAIGLASLGVLVLIFLLKFLFKSHKVDRSHFIEINRSDEPELFGIIDEIVEQVGTMFPKKVYLSADVNASVFYDSSFWSMFLPVKKNLQIGLGLVNTITKSELKAILSHEFGHFSQKSMKVGSFVYNVNQIIFNLLYDNNSYEKLIDTWGSISNYIRLFVLFATKVIEGIQWVLRKLYSLVNMSYMGLSREMEFHADLIAAHVTGCEPLKSSLLRMDLADTSFNSVLNFYDSKVGKGIVSENIYKDQLFVLNFIAQDRGIDIIDGLPNVSEDELRRYNKSRLVIEDQWASHPSTEDRIKLLKQSGLASEEIDNESANLIFRNIEERQIAVTSMIFMSIPYAEPRSQISFDTFQNEYIYEYEENSYSKIYNGYYDSKNPTLSESFKVETNIDESRLENLFSDDIVELVRTTESLKNDIETLKQIDQKILRLNSFDYDGQKYTPSECFSLINSLIPQLHENEEQIKVNDLLIFEHFLKLERKNNLEPKLEELYREYGAYQLGLEKKIISYSEFTNELQFVSFRTSSKKIKANFLRIEPLEEKVKDDMRDLLNNPRIQTELTTELQESFDSYLPERLRYFGNESYFNSNLNILYTALNNYIYLLNRLSYLQKKHLLKYQIQLISVN